MSLKSIPLNLIFFCTVLCLMSSLTFVSVVESFAYWEFGVGARSIAFIAIFALVFCVVPVTAIFAIIRRKLFGLYLGLVPLILIFGFALRFMTEAFTSQISPRVFGIEVYSKMATVGFAIGLGLFIIKLGFSKTVAAYLSEPPASAGGKGRAS
jgi:hypothetical protein